MARVVVEVMLKPEIHDPQGEAIRDACHRLGFRQVTSVRQGKMFVVEVGQDDDAALDRVAKLAGELLANPVIECFAVRLAAKKDAPPSGGASGGSGGGSGD